MNSTASLYIARSTIVHACDARVKIVLLLIYTITIFFADTLLGVALFTLFVIVSAAVGKLPARKLAILLIPIAILSLFALFFNAINAATVTDGLYIGGISALRMMALAIASFVVCFTTTSTDLVQAFIWLLRPLAVIHVPVGDIALVLSLALRFIPMIFEELTQIRNAQSSRGASLSFGSIPERIRAWGAVFIPLFVNLFRQADRIAVAMDARCYGAASATVKRTSLSVLAFTLSSSTLLLCGVALLVLTAFVL